MSGDLGTSAETSKDSKIAIEFFGDQTDSSDQCLQRCPKSNGRMARLRYQNMHLFFGKRFGAKASVQTFSLWRPYAGLSLRNSQTIVF